MSKTMCPLCIMALCDFCRHFDFNGEDDIYEGHHMQVYVGKGWCRLHSRRTDPEDECDDFHCRNASEMTETK